MNFYLYKANVNRVIDGDTVVCDIDLGFDIWMNKEHVRLLGINAPEIRTRDLVEKAAGLEATAWLKDYLELHNNKVILETVYDNGGKYGRTLATFWVEDYEHGGLVDVNQKMVTEGYAVVYN